MPAVPHGKPAALPPELETAESPEGQADEE